MSTSRLHSTLVALLLLAVAVQSQGQTVAPAEEQGKLIAVLQSDAPHKEKVDACRFLAVIGTKDAVPALAALLDDEQLSHMARYALEPIPDPAADAALREAAGKLKGKLLIGVIGSIGVRGDAKAIPTLTKLLGESDVNVAQAAARSLGRIRTPEAAKVLTENLAKASAKVRPAIANGCLSCAEALLEAGKRAEAVAIYETVSKAELPKHFRLAATRGVIRARKP